MDTKNISVVNIEDIPDKKDPDEVKIDELYKLAEGKSYYYNVGKFGMIITSEIKSGHGIRLLNSVLEQLLVLTLKNTNIEMHKLLLDYAKGKVDQFTFARYENIKK
jgi:hypothetical protein